MDSNTKLVEKLDVVAKDIPILVDVGTEVGFHNQLAKSDMEIAEHLVMDDPITVGGELCIIEHLVVSNEISGFLSFSCVIRDLDIIADVDEGLLMKYYV